MPPLDVIGWVVLILIALVGFSLLRSARRVRRGGFGVGDEERRLRDDPRFTEDWVRQFGGTPPSGPAAGTGGAAPPADDAAPPDDGER